VTAGALGLVLGHVHVPCGTHDGALTVGYIGEVISRLLTPHTQSCRGPASFVKLAVRPPSLSGRDCPSDAAIRTCEIKPWRLCSTAMLCKMATALAVLIKRGTDMYRAGYLVMHHRDHHTA